LLLTQQGKNFRGAALHSLLPGGGVPHSRHTLFGQQNQLRRPDPAGAIHSRPALFDIASIGFDIAGIGNVERLC
jgi:hypothetical protein